MEPFVNCDHNDGVCTVTFFHPKGNSLTLSLLSELAETISNAPTACSVIILKSSGSGAYCAGASFDELMGLQTIEEGQKFFFGFAKVILAIRNSPKPVIARVHGKVAGGGVGILAAADIAVGVESASIRLSELAIGLAPMVIGPVLKEKIGLAAFGELAYSTEWKDARWAKAHSLYHAVCSSEAEMDEFISTWADRFKSHCSQAVAKFKDELRKESYVTESSLKERAFISAGLALTPESKSIVGSLGKK